MKIKGKDAVVFFKELKIVRNILTWSKETALPGFQDVPIYYVIRFIIQEVIKDNITTRANSVAFNFFLALFPFLIFLLPLLAQMPWAEVYLDLLRTSAKGVLPQNAEEYIFGMINSIQTEGQFGWLTLGFFLSLFFSSNGMLGLMSGFDKSYEVTFKSRGFLKTRWVALLLTMLLCFLLIVSILFIIIGNRFISWIISYFELDETISLPFTMVKWMAVLILFYSVITSIYRYGPSMYKKVKIFSPGATLATFLSILTSMAFSAFINNFGRYNEIYGSIGALIVILLWLQLNSFILLTGFELNASIAVNRDLGRVKLR